MALLHARLLSLPYFWDEAGYYIPAARDFFLHAELIPTSTLSNAHPPLPSLYLALWWKLFGYSPVVTRLATLAAAAFGVVQLYRIGIATANKQVAMVSAALFVIYPVYFAQSSLAHADIFATALALWGLAFYFEDRIPAAAIALSLGALAKETDLVVAGALCAWELATIYMPRFRREGSVRRAALLATPAMPLAAWYAYHFAKTGHVFGNAEFFRYNVSATLSLTRFLLAALQRFWLTFGHMNLFVLTGIAVAAMLLPAILDGGVARERIPVRSQLAMASVVAALVLFHSLIGGALLARYTMTAVALVVLIAVSTLRRRMHGWLFVAALVAAAFVTGWFLSPPYGFAPEDNLRYADYIRVHQDAAAFLEQHDPHAVVLTAWPATDELSKPYLGYVGQPLAVTAIEDFSLEQMWMARKSSGYDYALLFSTKQEPAHMLRWKVWEAAKSRYFDYHRDVSPAQGAQILGGIIAWQEQRHGEWAALIAVPRARVAALRTFGETGAHPRP